MDHPGGLRCRHPFTDGPGTDFLRACREKGLQVQRMVCSTDQLVDSGLLKSGIGKEIGAVFLIQLGNLGFQLSGNHKDIHILIFQVLFYPVNINIT